MLNYESYLENIANMHISDQGTSMMKN